MTTKRVLAQPELPSSKRLRRPQLSSSSINFDSHLSEEIVFSIFSCLSYKDLCRIQTVNHLWGRIATDNQLWKELFYTKHPLKRLRGGSHGFAYNSRPGADDRRTIKRLPQRALATLEHRQDWKWMYRIASNWENGRCMKASVTGNPQMTLPNPPVPATLLAGPLTIVSFGSDLMLHSPHQQTLALRSPYSTSPITALALDQSPSSTNEMRVAAFNATGSFSIYSIRPTSQQSNNITATETYRYARIMDNTQDFGGSDPRTKHVVCAAYHHPLLITLSSSYHVSIYTLPLHPSSMTNATSPPPRPKLCHSLHSYSSFPPSDMSLTRVPDGLATGTDANFKVVLTYAIPVFPAHWSIGATELVIACSADSEDAKVTSSRSCSAVQRGFVPSIYSTSSSNATPASSSDDEDFAVPSSSFKEYEQWGRKVGSVVGTQTDGKWVVLAGDDNTLQVYRLHRPSSPLSNISLSFVQTLFGHTGGIAALRVSDGRCVSLGKEGRMWVWDLEARWAVQVGLSVSDFSGNGFDEDRHESESETPIPRMVVFDERRIVTSGSAGSVDIWRFDL